MARTQGFLRGTYRSGVGIAVLSVGVSALLVTAHDEDWRKLADLERPVIAPKLTGKVMSPGEAQEAGGFASYGVELLAWLPLSEFGTPANGNDCWGYVSPSGREYAIFGNSSGTHFVEVTDPINPQVLAFVDGPDSLWRDIKVYGRYAYIVSEGGNGVQIVDLDTIDSGTVRFVRNFTSGWNTTHNISVNPDTPYLYLSGPNTGSGALMALSIADPENPVVVGQWNEPGARYTHDAQIVSYTSGPMAGHEIAYCFDGSGGFDVLDVTDKQNITRIGSSVYPYLRYCHQGWLSADRRHIYINDELDEGNVAEVPTTLTRIFNVEDPSNPTFVGTFTSGSPAIDHNLYTLGDFIFESNYRSGLRVFYAEDPTKPVQVAYFDSYPANDNPNFNGTWSNYPYFPSGTIILSDMERGLFVLRLDDTLDLLRFAIDGGDPPSNVTPGSGTTLTVEITSEGAALDPGSAVFGYRIGGGAWNELSLSSTPQPGVFTVQLPTLACQDRIDYYVAAENTDGFRFSTPQGAPFAWHSAEAIVSRTTVLAHDMETAAGWVSGAAGDDAATGQWERADPEGTSAQPEDDHTPAGTDCWVTGAAAGAGAGSNDIDGGTTTLLSPVFDLSAAGPDTQIGYWRWYSNSAGAAPNADVFVIDISNNGGASWTNVETVGPAGAGTSGGWIYHEFSPGALLPVTANMRMRFVASDLGSGSLVEAAIDDFAIVEVVCEAPLCPGDYNGDGVRNSADFFEFFADFFGNPPNADYNGDMATDSADFFEFFADFFGPPCD